MGWDGTGTNCYGMGWDRKKCPMDKPADNAVLLLWLKMPAFPFKGFCLYSYTEDYGYSQQ